MGKEYLQYESVLNKDQLFQGDVLKRTEKLEGALRELYPYPYENPGKYPYFVVLTQSCDLYTHNGQKHKADHITLAAARPIQLFMQQEVSKLQTPVLKELGICLSSKRDSFLKKTKRLLSNEAHPYFYLHPSTQTPFAEAHVVYLRITFPLRTNDWYGDCLEAKLVQLLPEFQAKLGWLTTLVFGRVATRDFDSKDRDSFANQYINGITGLAWRKEKALLNEARQRRMGESLRKLSAQQITELIEAVDKKSHPEVVADLIVSIAKTTWPDNNAELDRFRSRLLRNSDFKIMFSE